MSRAPTSKRLSVLALLKETGHCGSAADRARATQLITALDVPPALLAAASARVFVIARG
jgi:hypothetical protein